MFSDLLSHHPTKFKSSSFAVFMQSEIPLTKSKQMIVIEMYLNSLKLFQGGNVDKQKMFAAQVVFRQKKGMSLVRSAYSLTGGSTSTVTDGPQSHKAFFSQDSEKIEIGNAITTPPSTDPHSTTLFDRAKIAASKTSFSYVNCSALVLERGRGRTTCHRYRTQIFGPHWKMKTLSPREQWTRISSRRKRRAV